MNPIFNEYLTFLRDTSGKQLFELKEGYFWLDNQIIKGFDKQGNIHKFYRIKISVSTTFKNIFLCIFYQRIIHLYYEDFLDHYC